MKIAICNDFDETNPEPWGTPKGFANCLRKKNHTVCEFGIRPKNSNFSRLRDEANQFDLIMFMWAGPSLDFDNELRKFRQDIKIPIFLEAGDDIPISNFHDNRVGLVDAIFTPDLRCHIRYLTKKLPSYWMPSWCDDQLFYKKQNVNRQNICTTTCGDRPFVAELSKRYGNKFINKRVWFEENTEFYNSGTVVYQYARYNEITRRLFEAGGCGNAILTNRISADTGIYKLFVEDEDICYFSDLQECIRKMDRLFEDDDYRNKITTNMYNKITKSHMVSNRVDQVLNVFSDFRKG